MKEITQDKYHTLQKMKIYHMIKTHNVIHVRIINGLMYNNKINIKINICNLQKEIVLHQMMITLV